MSERRPSLTTDQNTVNVVEFQLRVVLGPKTKTSLASLELLNFLHSCTDEPCALLWTIEHLEGKRRLICMASSC